MRNFGCFCWRRQKYVGQIRPLSTIDGVAASLDEYGRVYATGRRKTSVARVWLKDGSGQFVVNSKPLIEYFQPMQRQDITLPFAVSGASCLFDVICTVKGGGISGKA